MSESEFKVKHKNQRETIVAFQKTIIKSRDELPSLLDNLRRDIGDENLIGPPFCVFQFVSSVKEGNEVEVGFPVKQEIEIKSYDVKVFPGIEVLSFIYQGPLKGLGANYGNLYGYAYERGLISDEFCREVYHHLDPDGECEVEIQFVIHNWHRILGEAIGKIMDEEKKTEVMRDCFDLTSDSSLNKRFQATRQAVQTLLKLSREKQRYDILSRCAHVFPAGQIEKLRAVYQKTKARTGNPEDALEAVLDFMEQDPGWGERPRREGNTIYSTKNPRDPKAYANAKTELERKRAYCFCPLIRQHLEKGMPVDFCYCGSGWYRQQWEGAIGKPVRIEIVKSLLKGDDKCEFAIYLPENW
ncbi:GyrI-like domain-containing protein [bacterium]|nr:GyrI-like domain-containing protein [bacterium]